MNGYSDILQAALALAPLEREELAITLFESFDEPMPAGEATPELSAEWRAEIARRSAAYKRGELRPVPWEQVREEVRRKYMAFQSFLLQFMSPLAIAVDRAGRT